MLKVKSPAEPVGKGTKKGTSGNYDTPWQGHSRTKSPNAAPEKFYENKK